MYPDAMMGVLAPRPCLSTLHFMNDVFISYAHIDDQPMTAGQRGWISQFHRGLEVRMAQLLGQELKNWRLGEALILFGEFPRKWILAKLRYDLQWDPVRAEPRFAELLDVSADESAVKTKQ